MHHPKKEDPDDRGSNPATSSSSLFPVHPSNLSNLFSAQHPGSIFNHSVVTSQQQADFLSAISSGQIIYSLFKIIQNFEFSRKEFEIYTHKTLFNR